MTKISSTKQQENDTSTDLCVTCRPFWVTPQRNFLKHVISNLKLTKMMSDESKSLKCLDCKFWSESKSLRLLHLEAVFNLWFQKSFSKPYWHWWWYVEQGIFWKSGSLFRSLWSSLIWRWGNFGMNKRDVLATERNKGQRSLVVLFLYYWSQFF